MYGTLSDPKEAAEAIADLLVVNFWTQEEWAKGDEDDGLESDDERATCFCAAGLIRAACKPGAHDALIIALAREVDPDSVEEDPDADDCTEYVIKWNDRTSRTRKQVREAFLAVAAKL